MEAKNTLIKDYVNELHTNGKVEINTGGKRSEDFKMTLRVLEHVKVSVDKVRVILNKCTIILL